MLAHSARLLYKATLVPLRVDVPTDAPGQAIDKLGFLNQLDLRSGEVESAGRRLRELLSDGEPAVTDSVLNLFASFARTGAPALLPPARDVAEVPIDTLLMFGRAVVALRRDGVEQFTGDPDADAADSGAAELALHSAALAVRGLEISTTVPRVGLMNLERLEMVPAGVERGELLSTVPLAPQEETAVTQKEWSVQKKEFTSIVTDSLETLSETGVTDNTELSQSTSSQQEHSNQFNITGTVKGGIPVISGSVTSGYTGQSRDSQSATESRKHATSLTQKASTRSKQEHKVTISTTTVSGTSLSTTRTVKNPSSVSPIRIDYFSLMRKWQVRLYRYGLRETYDIVLPEPAASLRAAYVELETLKNQLGPFVFRHPHSDITADIREDDPPPPVTVPPTPKQPHYLVLADRFHVPAPPPPPDDKQTLTILPDSGPVAGERSSARCTANVPPGYEIQTVQLSGRMTSTTNNLGQFTVEGTTISFEPWPTKEYQSEPLFASGGGGFLAGTTGAQKILMTFDDVSTASLVFTVECVPTAEAMAQWRSDVWNIFYNALQTQYYAEQEDIAGRIAALENRLANVDTLTLRREESDEVMKGVLRYLLGARFPTMPPDVIKAFVDKQVDITHGTSFDSVAIAPDSTLWTLVRQFEDHVRFVNQAIEWENVTTFLYSYFWDIPQSWKFIREIKHPDPNRQAFLRAGSARVVLTVRKGWETRWINYVERGVLDDPSDPGTSSPYWTIAQEIAAYDDRNYPGIPPANPGKTATRLQDSVTTYAGVTVGPSTDPVKIRVDSSDGFVVGTDVVIDSVRGIDHHQEVQTITAIPIDGEHLVVSKLDYAHTGTAAAPFPITQPGEKGELIAEWYEYTPTSGTDIALTSDLGEIS